MKKAYSYARFSSAGQADGNSVERQIRIAREWHAREIAHLGIPLDESLGCDEGKSAYTGKHLKGSLGHFLAEIKEGRIASGSILIAENLDRISRQGPKIARKLIERIVDNGVDVHICNINVKLTVGWENDLAKSVIVDVELGRALKESEYKSQRIGQSWRSNKRKTAQGRILTKNIPHWLKVKDGEIVPIPEKVKVVKECFRLAALGMGCKHIVRELKKKYIGVIAVGTLGDTLRNRAVLGEYQPHKYVNGKRVPEGEPVPDYYRRIISQSEWEAAREQMERKNRNRGGSRTSNVGQNLFTDLIFDKTLAPERKMLFQCKSRTCNAFLISRWEPNRKSNRIRYDYFENAFLGDLHELDWKSVAGQTESDEFKEAVQKLDRVLSELDRVNRQLVMNNTALDEAGDASWVTVVAKQISKLETRITELTAEKEVHTAQVNAVRSKSEALYSPEALIDLIRQNTPESNEVRLKLRAEIRKRVSRIDLRFARQEGVVLDIDVQFTNGVRIKSVMLDVSSADDIDWRSMEIVTARARCSGRDQIIGSLTERENC